MIEGLDAVTSGGSGGLVAAIIAFAHKYIADKKLEAHEKEVADKMEKIDTKITDHKLYAAQTYVTQEGLKNVLQPVISQLVRMEGKIDQLKETKADKP